MSELDSAAPTLSSAALVETDASRLARCEEALACSAPEAIASRRSMALRNAGRLAALVFAPEGLVVAAIAAEGIGARRALPPEEATAAAISELPGVAVWVWPASALPGEIGGDLATARAAFGEDARAVIVLRPKARVLSPPLQGEVGAQVDGVDAVPLVRAVGVLEEGELVRGVGVPWSDEAERLVARAGFVAQASRD
jgi:hypothetical protein